MSQNAAVLALTLFVSSYSYALPSDQTEPESEGVAIRHGESSSFPKSGVLLTFHEVRSDSRCPVGVKCIRAGEAEVVFLARVHDGEPSEVVFEVPPGGGAETTLGDVRIRVVRLDPQTSADRKIESSEYVATVRVEGLDGR